MQSRHLSYDENDGASHLDSEDDTTERDNYDDDTNDFDVVKGIDDYTEKILAYRRVRTCTH